MLVGSTGMAVMFVGGVAPATYGGKMTTYYLFYIINYCILILPNLRYYF